MTRFNGLAASRTIRALATVELPIGVRSLAARADVSPGSVSKHLTTLTSEGIVDRDESGGVVQVRRRALLKRWVVDYSFLETNSSVGYHIAARGLERALVRLADRRDVAITGSVAARRLLPISTTSVVPMRLLAIYAKNPSELADELGLIAAEPTTANAVIARPQDPNIFTANDHGGLTAAPFPLVIADLLTLPNRGDAEAEQLMDKLAENNQAWKE